MKDYKPVSVHDVASYILQNSGKMTAMKLDKLVYYAQAWSLVWDERPLFREEIQAWANGPVVPSLYDKHRGVFDVQTWQWGNAMVLDSAARGTVDAVLNFYGDKPAQWLSDLTHSEQPWKDARNGLPVGKRGTKEITIGALAEYYGGLGLGKQEQAEDGSVLWSITNGSTVWTKARDGFCMEGNPSNRTDEELEQNRFRSLDEAFREIEWMCENGVLTSEN